jgi:hypothetical protein
VREKNLRELVGLRPNAAVKANDGGGGELLAIDVAHQVVVDVRLPRHLALPPPSAPATTSLLLLVAVLARSA